MVVDHKGQVFNSVKEMTEAYGINTATYHSRIRRGWTVELALTTPMKSNNKLEIRDNIGKTYKSTKDMCEAHSIKVTTYMGRLKNGMSIEQALATPVKKGIEVQDHLGNTYESIKDMCVAYSVDLKTYRCRLKSGWSLEQALTTPSRKKSEINKRKIQRYSQDHLGNKYRTVTEMCLAYGIKLDSYSWRVQHGWTLEEALEIGIIPNTKVSRLYTGIDGKSYFLVKSKGQPGIIMNFAQIKQYKSSLQGGDKNGTRP